MKYVIGGKRQPDHGDKTMKTLGIILTIVGIALCVVSVIGYILTRRKP